MSSSLQLYQDLLADVKSSPLPFLGRTNSAVIDGQIYYCAGGWLNRSAVFSNIVQTNQGLLGRLMLVDSGKFELIVRTNNGADGSGVENGRNYNRGQVGEKGWTASWARNEAVIKLIESWIEEEKAKLAIDGVIEESKKIEVKEFQVA